MDSPREKVVAEEENINQALNDLQAEKIISQSLADALLPFLSFRHFFVHAYGFMLDDKPIRNLATRIPTVDARFVNEIDTALQNFEKPAAQP